jgi:hypothetical protein
MMKKSGLAWHENGILLVLLLLASALIYVPRLHQIGYLNDDWYLMYSAHAYGPQVFTDIYSIDRPMRALVLIPAYRLFGDNPLFYNLSAYVFRFISSVGFFWLLRMLWPRQRSVAFLAALLFLIYPGFLSQINGIDYQSQLVSLAAAMFSIALSAQALVTKEPLVKWFLLLMGTLLGWFYLGLVEYFLGLELLRFASLFILASRSQVSWQGKFSAGLRHALSALIIPVAFLIWRIFFFQSERGATDIGSQLVAFRELPLVTSIWWLARLISNTFYVTFLAWGIPLYQLFPLLSRIRDLFIVFAIVGLLGFLLFWLVRPFDDETDFEPETPDWRIEALLLGLLTAFTGLVPVILVNRQADFGDFSRYTLASSPGSALVLVSLLFFLSSRAVRWGIFSLLLAAAVFTHHANAIRVVNETNSLRAFWWQVAWRVPHLRLGTTLIANYPVTTIQEDYFVWGPANLIYYPNGTVNDQVRPGVSAAVLNKDTLLKIIAEHRKENENRRSIRTVIDYQNILVLSMPTQESCVQIVDGNQPVISQFEEERMMVILPYSDITNIDLNVKAHTPPQIVFGPEPVHDWCYYYEKADLARQRGDWEEVVRLGEEVLKKDYRPDDHIEWMPFQEAYARAGNIDRLDRLRRLMKNSDPYIIRQVCQNLRALPQLSDSVMDAVNSFYCFE